MSEPEKLPNQVKQLRLDCGWSQAELARRSGISRTAVSAIEMQRLIPSVAAALALAQTFGCRVEDLFGTQRPSPKEPLWAWPAETDPCRFWEAEVHGQKRLYPAEAASFGAPIHDGVFENGRLRHHRLVPPEHTLVMASCDPAATLLAAEYARVTPYRLLIVPRSSREALSLLGQNLIHIAGVHLSKAGAKKGNHHIVRETLGEGFELIPVARWDEGIAIGKGQPRTTVKEVTRVTTRWVGREVGSGARECLDELLEGRVAPRKLARDHRGVAEAIRCGWADYGVCVRLVAEEARLQFLSVRQEAYDLVHRTVDVTEPRIRSLLSVLHSLRYRELLGELPGYDVTPLSKGRSD